MKKFITSTLLITLTVMVSHAQNIGVGVPSPLTKLHINGSLMIDSAYALELGGRMPREINAGKIGYAIFTPGALDLVGAGTLGSNRKFKFWNEGGATFAGKVHLEAGEVTHGKTGESNNLLPVGIAGIQSAGSKQYGTSNISTSWVTDHYVIEMGEGVQGMQAIITVNSSTARFATVLNGTATAFWVYIWTTAGAKVQNGFNLVVYRP